MAVVIAIGVNDSGQREVLGMDVGPSELVTTDAHEGLKGAIAAVLQGASWQLPSCPDITRSTYSRFSWLVNSAWARRAG
jgi:transposase-like protein